MRQTGSDLAGGTPSRARLSRKHLVLIVLVALIALAPAVFPSNFYYRIGALIFVNGLAVTGLVVLIGFAGQISLGHAGFAGIGAYACALAPVHLGLHPGLAMPLGAVLSGVIAWLIGRPILRLKGYYLAVATLGFGILVAMVLANEARITGGPDGREVAELGLRGALAGLGLALSNAQFWYAATGLALHDSEIAARTVGIDVARLKLAAFVISAVYASLSGSLLALMNRFITPDVAGFLHSVELVTMTVFGGVGSVPGAILGAAALTLLPQALTVLQQYEHLILGMVMMLVMIFMPAGLLPSLARLLRRSGR